MNSYVLAVTPALQGENFLPLTDPTVRDVTVTGIPAGRTFTFGLIAVSTAGNSPTVSLTLRGTRLSLSTARSVPYKHRARLTGHLTFTNGVGVAGRHGTLYRRLAGQHAYHAFSTRTTNSRGAVTFRPHQSRAATYYVSFASKVSGLLGSRSSAHRVTVSHAVSFRADDLSVHVGQAVLFSGQVSPRVSGVVTLERRRVSGGKWSVVARGALDSRGRYALVRVASSGRDFAWRVVVSKAAGLDRGVSRTLIVRVT